MKNLLNLIVDAAKNDDMDRVIELAENQQDKFCDNNCVWTDHHPKCVRAEPEWYHVIDVYGCNRFYHRTEDCPYKVKTPLYTTPQQRKPLTDEQMEKKYREEMRSRNWEAYDVWLLKQQKTLSDNKIMEIRKSMGPVVNFIAFARAIEAAHNIKENT